MFKINLLLLLHISLMILLLSPVRADAENIVISTDREVYVAGDRLWLSLKLSDNTGKTSDFVYLTLSNTSGTRIFDGCMKVSRNRTYGSIYLADTLTSGIYRLVSYTNCMRNEGNQYYAFKNIIVVNRFDDHIAEFIQNNAPEDNKDLPEMTVEKTGISVPEITTDKGIYRQREKVNIHLRIPERWDQDPIAMSVRQVAPFSFVSSATGIFSMVTGNACRYLPERNGIVLQGTLKNVNLVPTPGLPVFLSCVDSVANLQHTTTNTDGIFRFFLNPYYFGKSLMIKSENSFKGSIEMDDKSLGDYSFPAPELILSGDLTKYIGYSQKFLTVQKAYNYNYLKESENAGIEEAYRPAIYECEPLVVYPSDFSYLPDFMEISREILPLMKVRERKDVYRASILDVDQNFFTGIYIFVDGILIEEVGQIISFDSKIIRKIETIPNIRFSGELKIPSILSVITTNNRIDSLKWKYPVVKFTAPGIMHLSRYSVPYPDTFPRNIPDFRQLLFWEPYLDFPEIKTLDFRTFTSDCTGRFEVVLTCSGKNGEVMEYKSEFNVERP